MMGRPDAERSQRELSTFYEVSKVLASSLDVAKTFREAINSMVAMMDWRRSIVVTTSEDGMLRGLCAVGLSSEEHKRLQFKVGEGVVGRVAATGMPIVVPDIAKEPLFLNRTGAADQSPGVPIAYMAVPIRADRRTLGVLTVDRENRDGKAVFSDDLRMLSMVATLMGQALLLQRSISAAHEQMQDEARQMHKALKAPARPIQEVVGVSSPMQEVFNQVHQVAPARTTVLLRGESGTGKEVIARAIHTLSPRKAEPFIRVNCAALTESLLESELFGHEKGSFTGAQGQRKGRFELAHGGSLFLDEIGDISASFQAKLLRVLQEREFERVGGSQAVKVDVRLILATNRNLEKMVQSGEFRADLYYRINVVSINLPPLRERREDIPLMAEHFLQRFNRENTRDLSFTPKAMRVLTSCYWPGNVRELENCVERTATMCTMDAITDLAFPCHDNRCLTKVLHHIDREDAVRPARLIDIPVTEVPGPVHHDHPHASSADADPGDKPEGERERLVWAMEKCGWVQAKAARLLNITPRQMGYALQKYQIEVRKF
jgi:Nif-specific regulatory protein